MADELLDIIDDKDIITGQEMRSTVHKLGLWHRGVHVFLFTDDGKMLIQKRSADRAASPSLLDCAVSEHIKAGEGYFEAAIRGLKEEMGVEGIEITPLVKFKMNYGVNDNEISVLYKGTVDPAQVKFDPVEIESIDYYSMNELQELQRNRAADMCGWFIEILNCYLNKPANMHIMEKFTKTHLPE